MRRHRLVVDILRAYPNLSDRVGVSGYADDLTTGLLDPVVPVESR